MPPKEEKKSEKTDSKKDEKKEPKQDEGLFLLEVLVDKIVFERSPCFTDKDFRTCVTVECSAIDPIEICDDDGFSNKSAGPFEKNFNSGRSVLFSLKEKAIEDAMNKFVVNVTIHKSLPCDCHQDTKIEMGKAEIDLTKEFVQARTKFLESPTGVSFEALKDAFRLTDPEGNESGDIAMFLRISCFGKLITTRFQGASSAPPNLGVGESSGNLDRSCDPKKEFQTFEDPCSCGTRGGGGGSAVAAKMPCPEADDPCCCSGPKPPPKDPMACRNTDPYCLHIPKGPSKLYEEIGSTVTGNELKIKVPASTSVIKKISLTHCAMQSPYVKNPDRDPCDPPCGKNQISLGLPCEPICCEEPPLATTQFTCTTEGCLQASKHGQLSRGDAKKQDLPNKDAFVLKIAKTQLQGDRKCKLELELVTPKGPDKKAPVHTTTTRVQCEPECECFIPRRPKPKKKRVIS